MICAICGHRLVNHGDRAITACDGGTTDLNVQGVLWGSHLAVCTCPGWKAERAQPPGPLS